MSSESFEFDYVNLNEVDPNLRPLDEGVYTLRITKAEIRKGVAKTGKNWARFNFKFQVIDHPSSSGRTFYDGLFANEFAFRMLRRLQDATGVTQEEGEPLSDWVARLETEQPEVRYLVKKVVYTNDNTGEQGEKNEVSWSDVATA